MINYREINENDIIELSKLFNELVYYIKNESKDEYFNFENLSDDLLLNKLKDDLNDNTKKYYIACGSDKIIGFISGEILNCFLPISKITKIGYISGAYVLEDYRNKGVISTLEKMMISFFKENNLKYIELNILSKNFTAKKSWEKLGYNTFREQMRKII